MKTTQTIKTLVIALALGAGTTFAGEEKEEKVAFDKLPEAVQKAIKDQAAAKSATVGDVEKEDEDGKVTYEAELVGKDGAKFEVEVAEDGKLIKVEADDDKDEKKEHKDDDKEEDDDDDAE